MHAEFVCGPPGSGKTTYCEGRRQFLRMQARRVITLNLDPANDGIFPYPCDIDIGDLVSHETVMKEENLGPNGAYLFCMDYISLHIDWIVDRVRRRIELLEEDENSPLVQPTELGTERIKSSGGADSPIWLLVDCPGQVEYYLHSDGMQQVINTIQRQLRFTVCVIHLCDTAIATRDVSTYVSTCLLALSTMTDLELPHLNVLTKWDTVVKMERPEIGGDRPQLFNSGGTRAHEEMEPFLDTPSFLTEHFRRLWKEQHGTSANANDPQSELARTMLEVVDGYGLVSFLPLDIQDQELMAALGQQIDAAVGHL